DLAALSAKRRAERRRPCREFACRLVLAPVALHRLSGPRCIRVGWRCYPATGSLAKQDCRVRLFAPHGGCAAIRRSPSAGGTVKTRSLNTRTDGLLLRLMARAILFFASITLAISSLQAAKPERVAEVPE